MNRAFLFILIGAALWGTIGWYVKNLYAFGFSPMEVVSLRSWSSALLLLMYMAIASPKQLKLQSFKDLKYFFGTGILSILFFNFCMFSAIERTSIPVATALLYTAPAFVTIFSFFLFKEPLKRIKLFALAITLLGTALVAEVVPMDRQTFELTGILFGLGSGIGYAFYSIFSKYALRKYSSLSITTYTFIVAAIALLPFFPYGEKLHLLMNPGVLMFAFGLGLLPTAVAYIVYTYGLEHTEASKASILTTIEPVVATLIGIFIFQETFSIIQTAGMVLILGAVFMMQLYGNSEKQNQPLPLAK